MGKPCFVCGMIEEKGTWTPKKGVAGESSKWLCLEKCYALYQAWLFLPAADRPPIRTFYAREVFCQNLE